jgi:hypothetical protein
VGLAWEQLCRFELADYCSLEVSLSRFLCKRVLVGVL